MKVKSLNSIVFHTENLATVKSFYSDILFLDVAEYEENDQSIQDISDTHVNYILEDILLCFESGNRTDKGTVILNVEDLKESQEVLKNLEVTIEKSSEAWFLIKDPDGRSVIFES